MRKLASNQWAFVFVGAVFFVNSAAAIECADMANAHGADTRVIAATVITPNPVWQSPPNFTTGNQPVAVHAAFCRIEAVIEKEIAFELWLPLPQTWNGRYLGLGNGGDAGFINYQDLSRGVSRGFASASTDTGHKRTEANWGRGHPDRVENFGYRAHHLLAVAAKSLIDVYYGRPAKRSYFMGCSGGGMQGLSLAQRYPSDYEGILSGAGGVGMMPLSTRMLSTALAQEKDPAQRLSDRQWTAVTQAAVAQCDASDGVKDGVVDDPRSCAFDPAKLQCSAGEVSETCLSPTQVQTVRSAYSPLKLKRGPEVDPGFPPGIRYSPTARQIDIAGTLFGDWTYQDPKWDVRAFSLERDVPAARERVPYLEFLAPNLSGFQQRGGKMLTYQGWMDPTVPAGLSVYFYENAVRQLGSNAAKTVRLFMAPGMEHCTRGAGPENFGQAFRGDAPIVDAEHDMLTALLAWVEEGREPAKIIASHLTEDKVDRTRPLCPYPERAHYKGVGDTDDAANFYCVRP